MIFAESVGGSQLIVMGFLSVLFAGVVCWRMWLARKVREEQAMHGRTQDRREASEAMERVATHVNQFELRLYDFNREVEGRIETRLTQLDQLVVEADREIVRLQDLLRKKGTDNTTAAGPDITLPGSSAKTSAQPSAQTGDATRGPLTPWQRRMVLHLSEAGYNAREVAALIDREEEEVKIALEIERRQSRGAA